MLLSYFFILEVLILAKYEFQTFMAQYTSLNTSNMIIFFKIQFEKF